MRGRCINRVARASTRIKRDNNDFSQTCRPRSGRNDLYCYDWTSKTRERDVAPW